MRFGDIDDYCAGMGMKAPGIAEYRYAMPKAPAGMFPPDESIWMAEAGQYNRHLHELGSVVVWYGPGRWNRGPVSADAHLHVACVDRLLMVRESAKSHYVGVAKDKIAELAKTTTQSDAMWCWAAVAQMIWALRGHSVAQQDIVKASFGGASGKGVASDELARRLHRIGIEAIEDKLVAKAGVQLMVSSDQQSWKPTEGHNPLGELGTLDNIDSRQLAADLYDRTLYILAYGTGVNRAHAVLLVGLDVTISPSDYAVFDRIELTRYTHKVTIQKYHVINPWPKRGYQVLSPDELQELVKWRVTMSRQVPDGSN